MDYNNEYDYLIAFGNNLRQLRKDKGFTQADLANDINIEISQISRIERGIINTTIYNAYRIAKVLSIDPETLFKF